MTQTTLAALIESLESFAPLRYAGSWDNVGMLVEPLHDQGRARPIRNVLLTIDLTEAVFKEAITHNVEAIIAYHPVIFSGLKRLDGRSATSRIVLGAAQRGIAIYSPHTALDAALGGLNDWLLEAFGPLSEVAPIEPVDPEVPGAGSGRLATLEEALTLDECVERVKAHLALPAVRLATTREGTSKVSTVAVCPGSGGSLFGKVRHADLFLTGEMRHHDVLARAQRGSSVILTDHTNTERGYLPRLRTQIQTQLGEGVTVHLSQHDRDPLVIV